MTGLLKVNTQSATSGVAYSLCKDGQLQFWINIVIKFGTRILNITPTIIISHISVDGM